MIRKFFQKIVPNMFVDPKPDLATENGSVMKHSEQFKKKLDKNGNTHIHCLLLEDNPTDIHLITKTLNERLGQEFEVQSRLNLAEGLSYLSTNEVDVIILDPGLPDSQGIETFFSIFNAKPDIPIIIMTVHEDEEMAIRAVQGGAQDYIVKGQVDGRLLERSILYAIERKRAERLICIQRDLGMYLASAQELKDGLTAALEFTLKIEGIDCGGIYLLNDHTQCFELITHHGLKPKFVDAVREINSDAPQYKFVMEGESFYGFFPDLEFSHDSAAEAEGLRAIAIVPIYLNGRVIAVLNVGSHRYDDISVWNRNAIEAVAAQLGEAIARLRMQEELRDSEEKFRKMIQSANDPIFVIDEATNRIIDANERAEALIGKSRGEIIGMPKVQLFPPEEREYCQKIFEGAVHQEESLSKELVVLHSDGRKIPVEISEGLIELNDKKIVLGIFRDVTLRKEVERKLRDSEGRYFTIFDDAVISLWEEDFSQVKQYLGELRVKGVDDIREYFLSHPKSVFYCASLVKISNVNKATVSMFKARDKNELLGNLQKIVTPESKEGLIDVLVAIAQGKTQHQCECVNKTFDDEKLNVLVKWSVVPGHEDTFDRVLVTIIDITERKRSEDEIRKSEQQFRTLVRNIPGAVYRCAFVDDWKMYFISDEILNICGYPPFDFVLNQIRTYVSIIHPDDRKRVWETINKGVSQRKVYMIEYRINHRDGSIRWVYEKGQAVMGEEGEILWLDGAIFDITERKTAEENIQKLSLVVEQSPVSVIITDTEGNIEYVNPKFVEITGYTINEVLGKNPSILKSGNTSEKTYRNLWQTITSGREWRGELNNRRKNGDLFWERVLISPIKDSNGNVTHFLGIKEDITVHKEYEERLLHQANFDELTDLPNRILALDRVSQAMIRARREKQAVAVMFIDLDQFRIVNDTLGHTVGDELLVEAARRLTASVRGSDTVARLGGDDFLVILPNLDAMTHSTVVAQKILDAFSEPFILGDHEIFATASIGITVYPNDGNDPHVLLRNSEAAMYRAKEESRNTFKFFTLEMNEQAMERMRMEGHLRHALEKEEMYLQYQPIFDTKTGKLLGVESLVRWKSAELGLVPLDCFIPLAEETGLITMIGEWVLNESCRQVKAWQDQLNIPLRISVNVSTRQFKGINLAETVGKALRESGLAPEYLELEITERLLMEDVSKTSLVVTELNRMGVRLSLDDFGTGYSSLNYLKKFPFHTLKIDRAFVHDVTDDPDDAALVTAIISMAKTMGLVVVGEGVETQQQLEFLRSLGCDGVQGFYFSESLKADKFLEYARQL